MGKATLTAICARLKAVLESLERDKDAAKPQMAVLRGGGEREREGERRERKREREKGKES